MRPSLRRVLTSFIPAAALALGTLTVGTGPASASATAGKPTAAGNDSVVSRFAASVGAAVIDNQDAISRFRGWMLGQPGYATSGYIGSIDDLPHKATTLLWSGPSSPFLQEVIAHGAQEGIKVSVRHRTYSARQLQTAALTAWHQGGTGQLSGFAVSSVVIVSPDYDGITVNGTYTKTTGGLSASQVRTLPSTIAGVPARLQPGRPATLTGSRDTDTAPFNAGGYMSGNGAFCSSGFAINYAGATHTTTAQHCNQTPWHGRSSTNVYGTTVATSGTASGRGSPSSFDGPYTSGTSSKIIGYEDLGVNDLVCTEGGNSGAHCNVKVTNTSVLWWDGFTLFQVIEAYQQTSGQIADIQGDSGGPVISLAKTSSGQERAAGMIQGYNDNGMTGAKNCGAVHDLGSNVCSRDVVFSSMRTFVNSLSGASLVTG
jgi:hypothetical protein